MWIVQEPVCIVDECGKILSEGKAASEPEDLVRRVSLLGQ
jgi:hypothetical protein